MSSLRTRLAAGCFLLSGATALVFELTWTRLIELQLGSSTLAVATILAVYMGGLGFGGALGGRVADRLKRPFLAYGAIEALIGLYALMVPTLMGWLPDIQAALGVQGQPALGLRAGLAAAVLGLPTLLMGSTLPILARAVAVGGGGRGGRIGAVYTANLVGAVAGVALGGFVLLPNLGLSVTIQAAAAMNGVIALLAVAAWRVTSGDEAAGGAPERATSGGRPWLPRRVALLSLAASGLTTMAFEVVWARALANIVGSSIHAFTIILATFLAALSVGSGSMSAWIAAGRRKGLPLAACQLGGVGLAFAATAFIDDLPFVFVRLLGGGATPLGVISVQMALAAAILFLPCAFLGGVFPLALDGLLADGRATGRGVGVGYLANTLGAIVGSLGAALVLLPALGVVGSIVLAGAVTLVASGAVLWAALADVERPMLRWAGAGLPLLVMLAAVTTPPSWSLYRMTSGVHVYAERYARMDREAFERAFSDEFVGNELIHHQEGATASVAVTRSPAGALFLKVNGKTDASTAGDMETQVLISHLPLAYVPSARKALVVGLASGVSVGSLLGHPLERVDVVEIEPAIVAASRYFDHVNGRPLEDPRTRLILDDARSVLEAGPDLYDVIVSEPSNPWAVGVASMFTRECFAGLRGRLAPGGVALQWLQSYRIEVDHVRAIVRSFTDVFPHVAVWGGNRGAGDLMLVGSAEPLVLQWDALEAIFANARRRADLQRVGVASPAGLLARYRLGRDTLLEFAGDGPRNTDDNMLVELNAPFSLYRATGDPLVLERALTGGIVRQASVLGAPAGLELMLED